MTDFYRAIADPNRRKILFLTSQKEYTQKEIVQHFTISQPAIKKHLNILLEEGLLEERREGKYCFYKLNQDLFGKHFDKLQQELGLILEQKLESLKKSLEGDVDE